MDSLPAEPPGKPCSSYTDLNSFSREWQKARPKPNEKGKEVCSYNSKALGENATWCKASFKGIVRIYLYFSPVLTFSPVKEARGCHLLQIFTFSNSSPINSVEREEVTSQSNFRIPNFRIQTLGLEHCVLRLISEPIAGTRGPGYADYLITTSGTRSGAPSKAQKGFLQRKSKERGKGCWASKIINTYPRPPR